MIVVTANDLPAAVRGKLKLWFIESKPNVFISGINDSLAEKIVEYLFSECPAESGLMIVRSSNSTPGYIVDALGNHKRSLVKISGLQLLKEK